MAPYEGSISVASQAELKQLRELTARVGSDPLLTQASTGNSSLKIGSVLWIKASGKCRYGSTRRSRGIRPAAGSAA
jgi:rhamnose utilization protein RhaD (predicted bifunctional aldolase and dehydrogenase)